MKKIIYILLPFLLASTICSCGSKKKTVDRKKESIVFVEKKDVQTNIQNDITSNVLIKKTGKKLTIEPKDASKESYYNGTSFKNAKITEEETTEEEDIKTIDKSEKDFSDNSKTDFESDKKSIDIDLDKDTSFNVFDWFWLFVAIAIVFFVVRLYVKKINPFFKLLK